MVAVLRVLRQEHADLAHLLDMVEVQLGGDRAPDFAARHKRQRGRTHPGSTPASRWRRGGEILKSCWCVPVCESPFGSQGRIESTRAAQSRRTSSSGGAFQLVNTKWCAR